MDKMHLKIWRKQNEMLREKYVIQAAQNIRILYFKLQVNALA